MPGFCGILSPNGGRETSEALERMLSVLRVRGNETRSTFQEGGVALGLLGDQIDPERDEKLLFDGLNKPSLPFDPEPSMAPFAYAKIKGKRVELARDPLGSRPLYWIKSNGHFLFASELKSLIASELFVLRPDLEALSFYLSLGYFPLNKTPFRDVYKVLPGHTLTLTEEGDLINHAYFSLSHTLSQKDESWNQDHLDKLAKEALDRKGLDPKKTARLSFESGDRVDIISSFDELTIDPIPFHEIAKELPQIVWNLDEPLASAKIFSFTRLCQKAKEQGYDNIAMSAGSLPWLARHIHRPHIHSARLRQCGAKALRTILTHPPLSWIPHDRSFAYLRMLSTHPWHTQYLTNQYNLSPKMIRRLSHGHLHAIDPEIIYHSFPPFEKMQASCSSLYYLYQKTSLINKYLLQYDRIPAAHGINIVCPYLNPGPLEYMAKMPNEQMGDLFKRVSLPRRKKPLFAQTTLFEANEAKRLFSLLKKGVIVDNGLIDPSALKNVLRLNVADPQATRALWTLLILEVWLRIFFEAPKPLKPPEMELEALIR